MCYSTKFMDIVLNYDLVFEWCGGREKNSLKTSCRCLLAEDTEHELVCCYIPLLPTAP